MTPGLAFSLRVPAHLQAVRFVRSAFACVLAREGWPAEAAGRVLLASSEALVNAIEHGSPAGGHVRAEIVLAPDRVAVRIVDEGRPGVPIPECPEAAPPDTSTRGRGLYIMRRLADDLTLRPAAGGTEVLIGFARPAAAQPALALAGARAA